MRKKILDKGNRRVRHLRIRKRVVGTPERPRLCIYKSIKHLEAQVINDFDQRTVFGLNTKNQDFLKACKLKTSGNVEAATQFGKYFAEKAKTKGISKVVFDRGGFLYHGRVKAFAEAAREGGLVF